MITHTQLGVTPYTRSKALQLLIKKQAVTLAGNRKLKIFGTMRCASGKRMNVVNRVFFKDRAEATGKGYRPCGHCMQTAYLNWKALNPPASALSNSEIDF